ncbi:MAG: hypothetical protein ACXVCE_17245 [Bacteriovorax sp.]
MVSLKLNLKAGLLITFSSILVLKASAKECKIFFKLENQNTLITDLEVVPNKQITLKVKPPEKDIAIPNETFFPPSSKNGNIEIDSPAINRFYSLFPTDFAKRFQFSESKIRNSSENPTRTVITVRAKGGYIEIKDQIEDTKIEISNSSVFQIEICVKGSCSFVFGGGRDYCEDKYSSYSIDVQKSQLYKYDVKTNTRGEVSHISTGQF